MGYGPGRHDGRLAIKIDLGDITATVELHVKGLRRPTVAWQIGPVTDQPRAGRRVDAGASTNPTQKGNDTMSDLVLTADQQVTVRATGKDADGNAAALGSLTWSVDEGGVLSVTDNGDGSALVVTAGPTGSGLVTVTDAETGGEQFVGSLAIDVVAGAVVAIDVAAGDPEPQGGAPVAQ